MVLEGLIDKVTNSFENVLKEFNKDVRNFVKYPLIILWLTLPLTLWGYIQTNNKILFEMFWVLLIISTFFMIGAYWLVTKQETRRIREILKEVREIGKYIFAELKGRTGKAEDIKGK